MENQAADQPEIDPQIVEKIATEIIQNQAFSKLEVEKEAEDAQMDTIADETINSTQLESSISEPPAAVEQSSSQSIAMETQETTSPPPATVTSLSPPPAGLDLKPASMNSAPAVAKPTSNALSLLAQYSGSESEDDEVDTSVFRKPQSSSSSSSSSDSDDDIPDLKVIEKKIREPAPLSEDDSDDENPGRKKKKDPLKVKGELTIDDLPPIEDLQISVDERECVEIGVVTTIVEQLVLVEALRNSIPLDIDSVLFLDNGKRALGQIFDVIGPVVAPIYCIRFNNHDEIATKGIAIGSKVFCAPRTEYSSFVILSNISTKGSDASWKNDIEPPENLIEHSDDEQERAIKRKAKASRNQQQPNERREFVRGRRYQAGNGFGHNNGHSNNFNNSNSNQPNLAYPNYSWHQNLPQIGPQAYPTNFYPPPPPQ